MVSAPQTSRAASRSQRTTKSPVRGSKHLTCNDGSLRPSPNSPKLRWIDCFSALYRSLSWHGAGGGEWVVVVVISAHKGSLVLSLQPALTLTPVGCTAHLDDKEAVLVAHHGSVGVSCS